MKKKIISVVLIVVIVFGYIGLSKILSVGNKSDYGLSKNGISFSDVQGDITDSVISSSNYILAENDKFILEINNKANIQVVSKTSDKVWKAVPDSDLGNSKYSSSLILTYFADSTTKNTVYSSKDSVNKNQYKIYKTENGARVEYIFGEMTSVYVYPDIISKNRLEKFLGKMTEDDKDYILRRYNLYVLDEYQENEKNYLLSEYPRLKNEDIYVLEDISALHMKKKVDSIFRSVGYTENDKKKDNGDYNNDVVNPQSFKMSVKYELSETGFTASLDLENCAFYNEYPIESIQILPYFDCFAREDDGYFVMPSGSGAITYVNSLKTQEEKIQLPVFGGNLTLTPQNDVIDNQCAFPMFGVYKNNSAYICSFNLSGQQTNINAEISKSYSAVYPSYTIIDNQIASLQSESIIFLNASELSTDVIEADYYLIDAITYDNAYSTMANVYRDELISDGLLSKNNISENVPFVANIINAINYNTMALGCFPVNKEFPLTTFDETMKIAEELSEFIGNDNLNVLLSGWNYKGLSATKFGKITYSKAVGGKDKLATLQNNLSKLGIKNYLNVEFNFITPHKNDRFNSSSQAVRDINNSVVNIEIYDPKENTFKKSEMQLISPTQFTEIWKNFSNDTLFKNSGMGVSQLTQLLYSDYSNGKVKSKGYSILEISKILEDAKTKNISVIGDSANIYALKYLDILNNIPIYSNNDNFFDKDIPFVQMVLHGYIDYATTTVNDLSVSDDTILKLIESGSGLHYKITNNSYKDIFETKYSYLYNTNFSNNKESIKDNYLKVSKALNGLNNKTITSHTFLQDDVVKVTYEDGTIIILNYGKDDYNYGEIPCKSKDYLRIDVID